MDFNYSEICFEGVENLGRVRRWAIQLKGGGSGGGRKVSFPYNSVIIEDSKKFQLMELLSTYAEKILYLKFFDSYYCLEVMG